MKYGLYKYARLAYLDLPSNIWVGGGGDGGGGVGYGGSVGCFVLRLSLGACWTKLKELVCKFWWLNGFQKVVDVCHIELILFRHTTIPSVSVCQKMTILVRENCKCNISEPYNNSFCEESKELREKRREKYFLAKWPLHGSSGACTSFGLIGVSKGGVLQIHVQILFTQFKWLVIRHKERGPSYCRIYF